MPDCDYCGASFDSESARDDHLRAEHADELGPIDERRLGLTESDDDGIGAAPVALGLVLVAAIAIVAYVLFGVGGGGPGPYNVSGYQVQQTPTGEPFQGVHYHGPIVVTIDGERLDFSRQRYQLQDQAFHFENGNGQRWHVHATGVTLEYGMATLGIGVADDAVTFNGTTYTDGENANVTVAVDGNDVDPSSYVLQDGDQVRIAVTAG